MTTNNKISNLVYSQVPFFVKNDHPNFIVFLEKYYEYLEQTNKTVERAKKLPTFNDIDITEDFFADILYGHFLTLLPANVMADKSLVLKYAKDFYRAKGTEKSIQFLLQILFGIETTEFYYPKTDILRASDGKWYIQKSIKINKAYIDNVETKNLEEIKKFANRLITGNSSGATAIVEDVKSYYENGVIVYEFEISNIFQKFSSNEIVSTIIEENGVTKTLTASVFGGVISSIKLLSGGSGYTLGASVPVESGTGTGGSVIISGTTKGNISGITISYSGAGFIDGNYILITGGGSSTDANGNILVSPDGKYHPNSYNVVASTIDLEANTTIGNVAYSNLSSGNVNTSIGSAVDYFTYANTGPVNIAFVTNPGEGFSSLPTIDIQSNTRIRTLGILGRMEIVNGGENYQIGDEIEFINTPFCYGTGAKGEVSNVDISGTITEVKFVEVPGHIIGGAGYTNAALPLANVVSSTGSNANIVVTTILGDGENLLASTETIGRITELRLVSRGIGYETPPTLNLANSGDGTAQAITEIITGDFSYPGRFINDDGMISSFNYLEDRDYYQNYSYVIRTNKPFAEYKKAIYDLVHPTGMKVFGEFDFINEDIAKLARGVVSETKTDRIKFKLGNYYTVGNANGSDVYINVPSHGIVANDNVYVEFITGSTTNLANVQIINSGKDYSNGFINIENGSGSGANASILVNVTGHIVATVVNARGNTYAITDTLIGNVSHLITKNIASVTINDGSEGYSNGYVIFEGGSGRNANANVSINATGSIVNININDHGTGYKANDSVIARVDHLVSYNIASINIAESGTAYSAGYINFEGGSGFGANASVGVDGSGNIISITINSAGYGYKLGETSSIKAGVEHLKSFIIKYVASIRGEGNYSNGYISFEGGTGTGANANVEVNALTGTIVKIKLNSPGTGYSFGDIVYANVESLVTNNIANVTIANSGIGYSNGYIKFEGGSGVSANATVTVNTKGYITSITINNRGTGYTNTDVIYANTEHLLTSYINNINIDAAGSSYSNGYIIFEGGSGKNANANISVDNTGAIIGVTINDNGIDYLDGETVTARISHLTSYNIANVNIVRTGTGYSNGYINFEGGSGFGANALIRVNATGAIVGTTILANGTAYITDDYLSGNVKANVVHLGGSNANLISVLQLGDPSSGSLSVNLIKYGNTSNLPVTLQKGFGNADIIVQLTSNTKTAVLPVTIQKFKSNANVSVVLQQGAGNANLVLNLQPEPLNTITNSIFLVTSSNTNWFTVQHPNTANIYGTSYSGIMI